MFRRSLGFYWRSNLGSRFLSIRFRWSNQFLWFSSESFTIVFICILFGILAFRWRWSVLSPNSCLKIEIFASFLFFLVGEGESLLFMVQFSLPQKKSCFGSDIFQSYFFVSFQETRTSTSNSRLSRFSSICVLLFCKVRNLFCKIMLFNLHIQVKRQWLWH